jgi:hypothetical protein
MRREQSATRSAAALSYWWRAAGDDNTQSLAHIAGLRRSRFERLGEFVIMAQRHWNHVCRSFEAWYNTGRPHEACGHLLPVTEAEPQRRTTFAVAMWSATCGLVGRSSRIHGGPLETIAWQRPLIAETSWAARRYVPHSAIFSYRQRSCPRVDVTHEGSILKKRNNDHLIAIQNSDLSRARREFPPDRNAG